MSTPAIGRYQVRSGLGRGAMGSVYLAWDPKMGREVAVKVLQKEYARDDKHRQRFEREARAIAALKHPNIVDIYDHGGSPDDHLFLVMEYIAGPHAGKVCREHGVFPESVVAAMGMALASALADAHEAGIIHRDLKPENIFFDGGRVVLGDFGIAKAINADNPFGTDAASAATDVIGTPGFMAPEQFEQQALTERTDIFSLGALLYHLASHELPFDADSPHGLLKKFQEGPAIPLIQWRPELSEDLSRLLATCLDADPMERPSSMRDVHGALREIFQNTGAAEPREALRAFIEEPLTFRTEDRARVVNHLINKLKVAVRDDDPYAVDTIRSRLAVLDPENADAARVTGVHQLVAQLPPSPGAPRVPWGRVLALVAAVTIAISMVAVTWLLTDANPSQPPTRLAAQGDTAILQVHATDRTHVFMGDRALGTTPNFPPALVASGQQAFEFVHDTRGRIKHTAQLKAGELAILRVNWKRRRVTRERGASGPDPTRAQR